MSKKTLTPRQKTARFWIWVAIYVEIVLMLVAFGLMYLWDYMAAYEASRPQNAIDAYMQALTPEKLSYGDPELLDRIDQNIQPEADGRQVIADSLSGGISYAKNTKLSTETELVYMVLSSGKTVGQVTMTVVRTDDYGLEYWEVTSEHFDFSHLIGESVSITVPSDYPVYANGVLLDVSYVTEADIQYTEVAEYYSQYDLPTMCTYTAGPVLGQITLTVTDPAGEPVQIDENTDMDQFLKNCSQDELDAVGTFVGAFVEAYTDFTSVTGGQSAMQSNYRALIRYILDGSKLEQRMEEAIVGLVWVTDRRAEVSSVTVNRCLRLEDGRYLCDFTYVVDTRDYSGRVQSTSNVKMIIVLTEDGLQAESMTSY